MGIRTFWFLIFVATIAAGVSLWPRPDPLSEIQDYGPQLEVVEIAREPEPEPKAKPKDPAIRAFLPASSVDHQQQVAPKPIIQQLEAGGTIEQEHDPRLVRMPDGSLIVEHFFRIAGGKGTPEEPYQLLWELLLSVQRNFEGPNSESELPQYVKFLDNKDVILNGVMVSQQGGLISEFTMSDMQLDNCPSCKARTIFSTVAVKLKTPENVQRGVLNMFTIRGRFRAGLIRENGYLVRVYALEEGEIISRTQQ